MQSLTHALLFLFSLISFTNCFPTNLTLLGHDDLGGLAVRGVQYPSTAADRQVKEVVDALAHSAGSKISGSAQALKAVEDQLKKGLQGRNGKKKIEVFFIIYGGSNGDVPLLSSVLQGMLDRPDIFDVKHSLVLGDSYRDFFPQALRTRFADDNTEWASKTNPPRREQAIAMFLAKMSSILSGWNPDLIVASHFIPPGATTPEQKKQIRTLTAPSKTRLIVQLQVYYLPGLPSTSLTLKDIKPNSIRMYGQQPEIWDKSSAKDVGAAMVGKLPRLSSTASTAKPPRTGEVYAWIDKQKQARRQIFYMGMGMKERAFDKRRAFPAFMDLAKEELATLSDWSYIILHNVQRSESDFYRTSHSGRVFHLFVGETSWATLFPEMGVVLTHGGVGSVTDAIAAGVPQIILPTDYAADQEYFAKRLEKMQIGVGLPKIPYGALSKPQATSVKEIRAAFAKIKTDRKHYVDGIKPFRKDLANTKAVDNAFEIITRMCAGLVARD
ncbi:uncharacterized protein yc1106_06041 [Curvularia clavata]|uniref:UDP-N-acetylglucosamine transferase subunit ALG13 n=1 Tax=Curvularia clavata TaxID=95742 RepID=A0A9Q8ZAW7_CURCL|nr:uncharacterized protein yc1106_06041 [Curvularia clavata]